MGRRQMTILDREALGNGNTARRLIENKIPSRVGAQDASVYAFSPEARATAENRSGACCRFSAKVATPLCGELAA